MVRKSSAAMDTSGLPQEIFVVLLFGAVLLVQFLYRQLRRKALAMQTRDEEQPEPAAMPQPTSPMPERTSRKGAGIAQRGELAQGAAPASPGPPAAAIRTPRTRHRAGRFSRTALMPDRSAVQSAIVIAAVLQPCHAHRPHEGYGELTEPAPVPGDASQTQKK